MIVCFFAQDPTVYGYQQTVIGEGKFRNFAKVAQSTRAGTTTIRFGQPNIQTIKQTKNDKGEVIKEELVDGLFRYPMTILSDIQRRPHLPPPPIEAPSYVKVTMSYVYSEG